MNKETVLKILNTAKQDNRIDIHLFTKPLTFLKMYIQYDIDNTGNVLIIENKALDKANNIKKHYININSIKSIVIVTNKQVSQLEVENNLIKMGVWISMKPGAKNQIKIRSKIN